MSTLATIDVEPIAQAAAARALELIAAGIIQRPVDDPAMTTSQIADRLDISIRKVRDLVAGGYLARCPGMTEIRVRQSVVDKYGVAK